MSAWLIRLLQHLHLYGAGKHVRDSLFALTPASRRRSAQMRSFYAHFVGAGDLCFDIGANLGSRVAVFRSLGASVIAVEPQEACVRELRRRFDGDPLVTLIAFAAGLAPGVAEMAVSQAQSISSMSPNWVGAVKSSGRFAAYSWAKRITVQVTTLDLLIAEFGLPRFCKIDVEGFEPEVLRGLSRPIPSLSFEFTPEMPGNAISCIDHLSKLGAYEFNLDLNESMHLQWDPWIGPSEMLTELGHITDQRLFGDVYARLPADPKTG